MERRIKIKLEEKEAVGRYLLNLKRELGSQIRLLTSNKINLLPRSMQKCIPSPIQQSRSSANTTPRATYSNMTLSDRSKMTCHKCSKIGYIAAQCFVKYQGFPPDQYQKRPPQPIRTIQENEYTYHIEMTNEEVQEQIEYEESAEYQPYADDSSPYEEEEEQENTDYWSTQEQQ